MKNVTFIGDIHGDFERYLSLLNNHECTIQVGDMGIGFPNYTKGDPMLWGDHWFIRGNHDNPTVIREHPHYLGDYGIRDGIFYLGGAWSIDALWRIPDLTWWADEELEYDHCLQALDLYIETKPDVVVTHDCPKEIQRYLISHHAETTRTNGLLQRMFEEHKPKVWVFGHHHKYFYKEILGTRFRCIPEFDTVDLEALL